MGSTRDLERLRPKLLSFALRRLGDRHRAEDAVQEKIVDALRAAARDEPLDYHEDVPHDRQPEAELAQRRLLEALDARLGQLPACAARVFVMREVMGMDTAEVCRELSISASNCWVMNHRARRRLRALAADAL
jgi:RNA polymerase sigma-70 factor (ECF subfamily)